MLFLLFVFGLIVAGVFRQFKENKTIGDFLFFLLVFAFASLFLYAMINDLVAKFSACFKFSVNLMTLKQCFYHA